MSKNLLKIKKSSTAMAIFQSRQCLFQSSHFVDKKTRTVLSVSFVWSEWRDLNSRPYGPEPYALPNCATPRYYKFAFTSTVASLGARRAFPLGLAFFTVDLKSYRILGISLVLFPLLSQTKLRYTPIIFCKTDSINPTAFAIYNNWRIFATKTRHLSQNLSFATLFFIYD